MNTLSKLTRTFTPEEYLASELLADTEFDWRALWKMKRQQDVSCGAEIDRRMHELDRQAQ